jgi:hypothetical protein
MRIPAEAKVRAFVQIALTVILTFDVGVVARDDLTDRRLVELAAQPGS